MANIYNAGQLATIIKDLARMDLEELGADDDSQNTAIFRFMNIVMQKMARMAYNVEFSDAKAINSDGYQVFDRNESPITDLFEPLTIVDTTPQENEMQKRTSYSGPKGWWRESNNLGIHVRGITSGSYKLKYIRYPKLVTLATDDVEIPSTGNEALIMDVVSLIKLVPNSYGGSEFTGARAKQAYGGVTQGAVSARGTGNSGQPPGPNDTAVARGGG
jgi:hypothetical protein